jgi:dCTP deaminase
LGICGLIEGRSKLAQQGISVEQSSKFIEPGSDSRMTLEIFNASDASVTLQIGQKIAKMVLLKVSDEI